MEKIRCPKCREYNVHVDPDSVTLKSTAINLLTAIFFSSKGDTHYVCKACGHRFIVPG